MNQKAKSIIGTKSNKTIWLWIAFLLALAGAVVYILFFSKTIATSENTMIRAGICGAVNQQAVYDVPGGADLAYLIKKADGLTPLADISRISFDKVICHDSIYHIPIAQFGEENFGAMQQALERDIQNRVNQVHQSNLSLQDSFKIEQINVLYVGFPSVFLLLNYYPDFDKITITHIPHQALLLKNDYRLIDIYFALGPEATLNVLERTLAQRIDFYMVQDRFSFIDFINLLGGIEVRLDKPFAETYNLKEGKGLLDGFHAWEFIRFIDLRELKHIAPQEFVKSDIVNSDNYKADPAVMQRLQVMRNHRQQMAMVGLRKAYQRLKKVNQAEVLKEIVGTFETNMTFDFAYELYGQIAGSEDYSFGTIPGYYKSMYGHLKFIPDIPGFKQLRNDMIRKELVKKSNVKHITY